MNESAELSRALDFVIGRIEQEAAQSGLPLSEEQQLLLNNLPRESAVPAMIGTDSESPPLLSVPRDVAYERLIALARHARRDDSQNPASDAEWKIAFIVAKLNRHPMSWLLAWAGMKERTPWWDRAGLIATALLLTGILLALAIFVDVGGGTQLRWIASCAVYVALLLVLWRVSRCIEVWQLRRALEKYRGTADS
jgi:hypothetical protein